MIDWADPGQRARLIERIGVDVNAYTVAQEQHSAEAVVATVAGHAIRLGQIFIVGDTGKGFATLDAANTYAQRNPKGVASVPVIACVAVAGGSAISEISAAPPPFA